MATCWSDGRMLSHVDVLCVTMRHKIHTAPTSTSSNRAGTLGVEHSCRYCESCPQLLRRHVCLCPENHPVWHTWGCSPSMFSLSLWLLQIIQGLDFSLFENASVEMLWRCLSVQRVAFCSTEGREGRGGEGGTSSLLSWWQLDDILTCMLISHTIITFAAVQSALSLWTRVATSGFTWTASLPTSLTASSWEPVRWGHLFKYSAPLCLWRLCAFGAPDAAVPHPLRLLSAQEKPITGRKADVIQAAHLCAEAALRLVKPGNQVSL